jgi:PadR family transcriptional regulator PadR
MFKQALDTEEAKSRMRKGMLEFCTLLSISKNPVYASDILAQLKCADLIVVEGTLYPLLTRLRTEGLLTYDWKESASGPPRKYYTLTEAGKDKLLHLEETWKSLVESINTLL